MDIGEAVHEGEGGRGQNIPASIGIGKVIKNWDNAHPGMVKVSIFAEAGEKVDSDWMPVMSPYAAAGCGLYALPDVGSIVIIGYVDDNSVSPVVIGTIWNQAGSEQVALPANTANEKNTTKVFCTSKGQTIKIEESDDNQYIEIVTSKKQRIFLDDKNECMEFSSSGDDNKVKIDGKEGKISIEAKTEFSIKVGGKDSIKITSTDTSITSSKLIYEGNTMELKGKQSNIEGSVVNVKSSGNLTVQSSGVAQVKGSMLKLN